MLNQVLIVGLVSTSPHLDRAQQRLTFTVSTEKVPVPWTPEGDLDLHDCKASGELALHGARTIQLGQTLYVRGRLDNSYWRTPEGVLVKTSDVIVEEFRVLRQRDSTKE